MRGDFPHHLVDGAGLGAVAQAEDIEQAGAAVGVKRGMGPRPADSDIGGARVHVVGSVGELMPWTAVG